MTTLYVPRLIETAEQAEALPNGTIMRSRTGSLCERGTITGDSWIWEEGWLSIPDAIEHLAPLTALVPIEAEEEAGSEWIGPDGDFYESRDRPTLTRLVTPWEEA